MLFVFDIILSWCDVILHLVGSICTTGDGSETHVYVLTFSHLMQAGPHNSQSWTSRCILQWRQMMIYGQKKLQLVEDVFETTTMQIPNISQLCESL